MTRKQILDMKSYEINEMEKEIFVRDNNDTNPSKQGP